MANRKQIQLKDLEAGAVYTLQIRAVDNLGTTSPWSPKVTIETIKDTIAPNAPSGLTWQVSGDDFVATWTEPTLNEDGSVTEDLKDYKVTLYDPAVPGTTKHYYTASERFEFNFAQNKAAFGAPEKRLTIEVRSRDLGGNTSATPTSKTAENGAPGNFILDAVGERRAIVLNWDGPVDYGDVATANPVQNGLDILEFDIYRGGVYIATVAGNTYTYNDADPGRGDHTYFIRARDVYSQETDSNNDTASASGYWEEDTVAPAAPTLVTGTPTYALINDGLEVEASFSWNAPTTNTDATPYEDHEGFQIRYGKNSSGPWQYIDIVDTRTNGTDAQQFTENVDGLDPGTTYYWGVRARDRYQNYSAWATTNKISPADTTAPNTPSAPSASGSTNYVLVSHDMLDSVGVDLPRDVVKLEVYISEAGSGFTADATNKEGEIDVIPGIPAVQSFSYPVTDTNEAGGTVDVWVKVKAVDIAGNVSTASAAGQVSVNLIENANILDATIGAAKIGSVFANSIVAGTGLINDLTVKANLTLGDNVTDGIIQSYPYTQDPSTGFYMDDIVGLIVNDGKISAKSLEIHDSPNLVDAGFADFEYAETWYLANAIGNSASYTTSIAWSRYREQSLEITTTAVTGSVDFTDDNVAPKNYNIPLEPSTDYILSAYIRNPDTVAHRFRMSIWQNDTVNGPEEIQGPYVSVPAGSVIRYEQPLTTHSGTNAGYISILSEDTTTFNIDGMQLEEQVGYSNEASFFKIGGATTIDGGNLSTGTIDANKVGVSGIGGAGRIELDGAGIRLFNATSGGSELIDLNTDGTILVRSSASGSRVEMDGSGLRLYDTDGTTVNVNLDAITGDATFTGNIYATGGEIDGNFIVDGTLATRKMLVGMFDNLIADPGFEFSTPTGDKSGFTDGWYRTEVGPGDRWLIQNWAATATDNHRDGAQNAYYEFTNNRNASPSFLLAGAVEGSITLDGMRPGRIEASEGDEFYLEFWTGSRGTGYVGKGVAAFIQFRDQDGASLGSSTSAYIRPGGAGAGLPNKVSHSHTAPAGTAYVLLGAVVSSDVTADPATTGGAAFAFDSFYARRKVGGDLLVAGDIWVGGKIEAGPVALGQDVVDTWNGLNLNTTDASTSNALIFRPSDSAVLLRLTGPGGELLEFDTRSPHLKIEKAAIRTSSSGKRVEINTASWNNMIAMYTGHASEGIPPHITSDSATFVLSLVGPRVSGQLGEARINLYADHADAEHPGSITIKPRLGSDLVKVYYNLAIMDPNGNERMRSYYQSWGGADYGVVSQGPAWTAIRIGLESSGAGLECRNPSFDVYRPMRASSFDVNSDSRTKDNIQPVVDDFISQAKMVKQQGGIARFQRKDPERDAAGLVRPEELGFIAQRLPEELQITMIEASDNPDHPETTQGFSLPALCAWQQRIIEQLIERVEGLEARVPRA